MKISDIYTAKGLKFKLNYISAISVLAVGTLVRIDITQKENEFLVSPYGVGINPAENKPILCKTDANTTQYLLELFETEKIDSFRCMFSVEGVGDSFAEIQAYTFKSVTEYKTPIFIQVPEKLIEGKNLDKLKKDYIWDQLGAPALFCLNYKNRKKQISDVRFFSGKKYLMAHNTPRGIIAENEIYLKERYEIPIDVYIAPEIKFVPETEDNYVNETLAEDLDKVSNPASYFARWEAYNELSKKLLKQESEEFGELMYSSYDTKADLTGITFEFTIDEVLDNSFVGKELGVNDNDDSDEEDSKSNPKQIAVGTIKKILDNKVITYLENAEGFDYIPQEGCLTLYTAGDKFIMARRDAARERMIKHQSPIKAIVALIEAGASEYELPSNWGSHKAVTDELKRNFKKAKNLNSEQVEALNIAINTPDIALIQGPPGTGKTTVIKAICERFREIYEAEERQKQKLDPEHILRSPKILISSFQNDAVDNAISAPLPGDIPAYRKTAKRTKDSTREQYQKALDKWYNAVCNSIKSLIEDKSIIQFVEERKKLSDEYLSYKNSGESLEVASKLIKHYLSFPEINYPQNLLNDASSVIKAANRDLPIEEALEDPIVSRLESQRTDRIAFMDDGANNAKRLLAHLKIREELDLGDEIIQAIEKVCNDEFSEENFQRYSVVIEKLKKRFCKHNREINANDKSVVNECLIALSKCFSNQYINTLSNVESKKSLILSEFLSRLEQEYETIVQKYSTTTAATCQTSLDLRDDGQKVFDLVVIDEAARANPLDLFIPMSMGKKIVLVGDHKQLPHMLEPDVLKVILNDPKFKDLPEIEKSLFERLFDMFLSSNKPKSVLLTHQYRMHPEICKFVSEVFYDGKLKTAEGVTPEVRSSPSEINDGKALTFVDIPISKGAEAKGVSKSRMAEVESVCKDVKSILEIDREASVGIITFYSSQATKIKQKLELVLNGEEISHVEVGTVDAFQGKEFDYVLLSCVRSNIPKKEGDLPDVGFLVKPNRLCVAFSRAIKQLIVHGDANTLYQIPCFSKLFDICSNEGGCYRAY